MKKSIIWMIMILLVAGAVLGCERREPLSEPQAGVGEGDVVTPKEEEKVVTEGEGDNDEITIGTETVHLTAGVHQVTKHIENGFYDVTFDGIGNLIVRDSAGRLITNVVVGTGIDKYRSILIEGDEVTLKGTGATFTPPVFKIDDEYKERDLYSGCWIVGIDLGAGRYEVKPLNGTMGNFIVRDKEGKLTTNEILGMDNDNAITVELGSLDWITVSGLNFTLTPVN